VQSILEKTRLLNNLLCVETGIKLVYTRSQTE